MSRTSTTLPLALSASLLVAGVLAWMLLRPVAAAPVPGAPAPRVRIAAPPVAASAPAEHPIAAVREALARAAGDTDAIGPDAIGAAIEALIGRDAVLHLLQTDDLPRRFVATVDNLGRAAAPARLWPINPTRGQQWLLRMGPVNQARLRARLTELRSLIARQPADSSKR